jgi:hypothetical protein
MADDHEEGLVQRAEDEVKSLEHEAEEGESARTPVIVLSGVTLVVAAAVIALLVISLIAYYATK